MITDIHLVPRMGCDPKNVYHVQNPTKVDEEKIHRSAFNNHVWYPLVNIQKKLLKMAIEIVDLPIKMDDYGRLWQIVIMIHNFTGLPVFPILGLPYRYQN